MRLKNYSFDKEGDYFVIKTLLRIFKEKMFNNINGGQTNDILKCGGINRLIERCYSSRKCHKSEPTIINYCYWPCDAGFDFNDFFYMVYIANIIKEFRKDMTQRDYKFVSKIFYEKLNSYIITKGNNSPFGKKADEYVFSNLDIIDEAFSKLGENLSDIMKTIIHSEKGLKNIPL